MVGLAAFGGHGMNATLMDEVRTKRGLAYGAYMTLGERRGVGAAAGWVFSGTDKTVATLKLVLKLYVALMEWGVTTDAGGVLPELPRRLVRVGDGLARAPPGRARRRRDRGPAGRLGRHAAGARARVKPAAVNAALKRHVHARDLAITMVATAPVMKKLLVGGKIKESAIDVVPWRDY